MRNKIIIGNWKMNGTNETLVNFLNKVDKQINNKNIVAGLAVPFTMLNTGLQTAKNIKIAAQNVHFAEKGAFTGEVSIAMLKELNVEYIIIGHSERREMFGETDETVNMKAKAILNANMIPVICCGESLTIKEAGKTIEWVNNQITKAYFGISSDQAIKSIIAYEPIWAIGTGKTATAEDAENVCSAIRTNLAKIYSTEIAEKITIQYGGSVNPKNIVELMDKPNIDGALVGGASLIAEDYLGLINY